MCFFMGFAAERVVCVDAGDDILAKDHLAGAWILASSSRVVSSMILPRVAW